MTALLGVAWLVTFLRVLQLMHLWNLHPLTRSK